MDRSVGSGGIGHGDGGPFGDCRSTPVAMDHRGAGKGASQLLCVSLALSHRTQLLVCLWLVGPVWDLAAKVFSETMAHSVSCHGCVCNYRSEERRVGKECR